MKKNNFIAIACLILIYGCDPLNERVHATEEFIAQANKTSDKINRGYKAEIRKIKPYKIYSFKQQLTDPFRLRPFVSQEVEVETTSAPVEQLCVAPQCTPPEPHEKTFLEGYDLASLEFVGTLLNNETAALMKTPDFGVVKVKTGDYLGRNNGKVIEINKSHLVLQEKILRGGIWKNKKTILVIKQ